MDFYKIYSTLAKIKFENCESEEKKVLLLQIRRYCKENKL